MLAAIRRGAAVGRPDDGLQVVEGRRLSEGPEKVGGVEQALGQDRAELCDRKPGVAALERDPRSAGARTADLEIGAADPAPLSNGSLEFGEESLGLLG